MSWHRTWLFARRTMKEIMRDPVNLFFGLAFLMLLLWALSLIYKQVGQIPGAATISSDELAAAIAAYAPVFVSLFSGMLIAKDRTSSFLARLFASPMTAADFILGYSLPMLVVALAQSLVTFLFARLFGASDRRAHVAWGDCGFADGAHVHGDKPAVRHADEQQGRGWCVRRDAHDNRVHSLRGHGADPDHGVDISGYREGITVLQCRAVRCSGRWGRLREDLASFMDRDCVCRGVLACRSHRVRSAQTQCEPVVAGIPEEYMQGRDITIWAPHSRHMAM